MYHIAKNILKNIFSLKVQFLSLVFLIVVFISVFASFTGFYAITKKNFQQFYQESNPSLFYLDLSKTLFNKGSGSNNIFDGNEQWSKDYREDGGNSNNVGIDYIVSDLSYEISNIIDQKSGTPQNWDLSKAPINFFFRDTRFFQDGFKSFKIINLDDNVNLSDKVILLAGRYPQWNDEVLLEPNYAYKNNLKINDYIRINTELFHIVGYGTSFDFSYPYQSSSEFLNNNKYNCLVYTYKNTFYYINSHLPGKFLVSSENQREIYLYGSLKDSNNLKLFNANREKIKNKIDEILNKNGIKNYKFYFYDDKNYPFYQRTHFFYSFSNYYYIFTIFFILLIMLTIFLIFYNIFLKRLSQEASSIRNFYYLGFSVKTIIFTYFIFPTIVLLTSIYFSLFVSILINVFLIHIFLNFFTIPLFFSYYLFVYLIIGVIIAGLITYSMVYYQIKYKIIKKKITYES